MKKTFLILACLIFLLSSCSKYEAPEVPTNTAEPGANIDDTDRTKINIANPKSISGSVAVNLHKLDILEYYTADLSFAGLSYNEKITSISSGYVTSKPEDTKEKVICKYQDIDDTEGNCLIICTKNETGDSGNPVFNILLLDYLNRKTYLTKSVLPYADPKLIIKDVTGDGLDDIIAANAPNGYKSGTFFETFRFTDEKLKSIYNNVTNDSNDYYDPDSFFSGYLIDDYKAVLRCSEKDFKHEISLLEMGYSKENLEIDNSLDPDEDDYPFIRGYENGKFLNGSITDIYVGQLSDIEGLDFISSDIGYNFKLKYPVFFGHNNLICELYAYLKYDASHDTFKLYMSQADK